MRSSGLVSAMSCQIREFLLDQGIVDSKGMETFAMEPKLAKLLRS